MGCRGATGHRVCGGDNASGEPYLLHGIAVLVVFEGNIFFFACKVCSEHKPYLGSIFKVDLHLERCLPLSKPDPHADQVRRVRSSVEGKCGGPEGFNKNWRWSKCAAQDEVPALEEGLQHLGADLNAPYLHRPEIMPGCAAFVSSTLHLPTANPSQAAVSLAGGGLSCGDGFPTSVHVTVRVNMLTEVNTVTTGFSSCWG